MTDYTIRFANLADRDGVVQILNDLANQVSEYMSSNYYILFQRNNCFGVVAEAIQDDLLHTKKIVAFHGVKVIDDLFLFKSLSLHLMKIL